MENKLRELAKEFCKQHTYANEDDIYNFLVENQWKIYADYQRQSFKNMIKMELDEQGDYNIKKIPEKLLDIMAEEFEEQIFSEDNFRDCINETLDWYEEDLEEYKIEED